jgi:hypothetical protein
VVSKERYMYLNVSFKRLHLANAAQEGERAAPQKFAQGSGMREGVSKRGLAYLETLSWSLLYLCVGEQRSR